MIILAPFGWVYGQVVRVRNALYDRGLVRSHDLGAKTISVGNITTGGTGKTPLVAYIANLLAENGEKVCILSRGYGRTNENERVLVSDGENVLVDAAVGGDEPVELARRLLGKAIVIADADRAAAAEWARSKFAITAFVLDDAFQHRRVKRDIDIVCVDATDPVGNGKILPAGKLRESLSGLARADAVVITRSEQGEDIEKLQKSLPKANPEILIFRSSTRILQIVALEEFHAKTQSPQRDPLGIGFAFTGIGNSKSFFKTLEADGLDLAGELSLKDHFNYTQKHIEEIEAAAMTMNARFLITTGKDAVKLVKLNFSMPCYVAEIETVIDDPSGFHDLLLSV